MLNRIRQVFFRKALREQLQGHTRQRRPHNLDSAQTVGVLFEASDEGRRKQVQDIVQELEKKGKKVQLLGFFDARVPVPITAFPAFTRKDLGWNGIPKNDKCEEFVSKSFDILLCLEPTPPDPLIWAAALSKAGMKIGFPTPGFDIFDLALEVPQGKDLRFFMDQLKVYLAKIQLPANVSATAS
jgi:hypothetical protein